MEVAIREKSFDKVPHIFFVKLFFFRIASATYVSATGNNNYNYDDDDGDDDDDDDDDYDDDNDDVKCIYVFFSDSVKLIEKTNVTESLKN